MLTFLYDTSIHSSARLICILTNLQYVSITVICHLFQFLVAQQDTLASSRGDIVRYLIAVYKSLGGGWQSRVGKDIVPKQTIEAMGKRTDWGDLLKPISLPAKMEQPPTGKEIKVLNTPEW